MKKRYILFNKPYGVLTQFTGTEDERTLAEFSLPKGVYAAGRLDKDSEGLLLLTDDGAFKDRLTHPRFEHYKTYLVQVEGIPTDEAIAKLCNGVVISGYKTKRAKVQRVAESELAFLWERDPPIRFRQNIPTAWLRISIYEGKNRQVRRMTAAAGYPTLRLIRVAIMDYQLENLRPGEWREVSRLAF